MGDVMVTMVQPDPRLELILGSCMGSEEKGAVFGASLRNLMALAPRDFSEAAGRIEHETSIGPMLNPSAYLDGKRFENGRKLKRLFEAAGALRKEIDAAFGTTVAAEG